MTTYYAVKVGNDRYDLRQDRYREMFAAGKEHKHDLMAVGFTGEALREICTQYGFDADLSALEASA